MKGVIRWAFENRLLSGLLAIAIVVSGIVAALHLPIDAVPDVTNIQVQVVTRAPALSATEVETQITQPVERAMAGTPGLVQTRSVTKFGISIVTLVFRDDIDTYFARAQVSERLTQVRDEIPAEIGRPELGPISTALGEIYMFELRPVTEESRSDEELRTIVEWQIAPRLRLLKGVVEVIGFGGALKQYRVTLDPSRLAAYGISAEEIRDALRRDNAVSGGGYIERDREQIVLRGDARFRGIEDISATVVRSDEHGTPVQVGQLGTVDTGAALRQGAMTRDGRGEIVGGSVLMLKGENSREVVSHVKEAVRELGPRLPAGVTIEPYYDRAEFIDRVLATVAKNLSEGALFVVGCLFLTLGTLRAGLLVAGAIPFAMLTGFLGLHAIGYSGNVMSLGAIDFGIVVEGAVVAVEHLVTHAASVGDTRQRRDQMLRSLQEVARPVVFGVTIVLLVFLPLATLEDVEGKMFRPVVFSLSFMLAGALFYALVVIPCLAGPVLGGMTVTREPIFARWVSRAYRPVLGLALRRPRTVVGSAFGVAAIMLGIASTLGAEFLPRIFEGSLAIDALRPPSTALTQAVTLARETELALREVPEVSTVVDRIGRPEGAVDFAGAESSDVFVILAPKDTWRKGLTVDRLVDELSAKLEGRVPATINAFSQPIEMRVNDLIAGVKSDLAIKVFGEDLNVMSESADRIRKVLMGVPGAADVKMEVATGLPGVSVKVDRARAARLGVAPRSVLDVLEMTRAGQNVGNVREGERIFDLVVRLGGDAIHGEADLARLPVSTRQGDLVPVSLVSDVRPEATVAQIGREQMRRRIIVQTNIRGRDMVGFVGQAQAEVAKLAFPQGIELVWGGQFQNFNRAQSRLARVVPISLGVIALMLVLAFGRLRYMLVTVANLPFALAGGAVALVLRGLPFSIPAGVGFIALAGVSVMNGVVMTTNFVARPPEELGVERARNAALSSLRAIVSTALVAAIGFVPAALATGTGAEVQRPLATVVIGGLVAAMLLSLPSLPAMLHLAERFWSGRRGPLTSWPPPPAARQGGSLGSG